LFLLIEACDEGTLVKRNRAEQREDNREIEREEDAKNQRM
jgi:hypothetical protein